MTISKSRELTIFEGMNSLRPLLESPPFNDRKIVRLFIDSTKVKAREKEMSFLTHRAEEMGFPIVSVTPEWMKDHTQGTTHGGICAEVTDRTFPSLSQASPEAGFYAYLEGIEDPFNFGFAVRSLYACGVDGIVLSPRNWMSAAPTVAKSSAGTSERLPFFLCEDPQDLNVFKARGFRILAAGIRNSVSAWEAPMTKPLLLVIGGEKRGISASVLSLADAIVRIDYGREFRGSLSAASAAAVLGYEVVRQNSK